MPYRMNKNHSIKLYDFSFTFIKNVQFLFKKNAINEGKQTKLTRLNTHIKVIKYVKIYGCIFGF